MEHKIYVGNYKKIKKSKAFLSGSLRILYAGMPNNKTFSLSPFKTEGHGHQGFSPNIYYDINSTKIFVLDMTFAVVDVTPQYIILSEDYSKTDTEFV